jgi:hypothetical protein
MDYDPTKFVIGPCAVSFKSTALGGTDGAPKIDIEPIISESKCDQLPGLPARKIILGFKIGIKINLKEIETGFAKILDADGKITTASIGSDLLTGGGALLLTPTNGTDSVMSFPNAVLIPKTSYEPKGDTDHILPLEFESYPDADGVYVERAGTVS